MVPIWAHMCPIWAHMGLYRPIWGPYGLIWGHIAPYRPTWAHMGPIWQRNQAVPLLDLMLQPSDQAAFMFESEQRDNAGHSVEPVGSEKFGLFGPVGPIGPWPATAGHGRLRVGRVGPAFGPVDFAANPCLITCLKSTAPWQLFSRPFLCLSLGATSGQLSGNRFKRSGGSTTGLVHVSS